MLREGEGHNSPSLISEGLQEGPVKNSTQKIQNTLTSLSRNTWKCRSASVLPKGKKYIFLTPPVPICSLPKKAEFLLD